MPICTQEYPLNKFNFVSVPEKFQDDWKYQHFGYAKKSYSRFASMERLLTINDVGGVSVLTPVNDEAFVDADGVTWKRLAYSVTLPGDCVSLFSAYLNSDMVFVLCETVGDGLNLYSGSRIKTVALNSDGNTHVTFAPKKVRYDNRKKIYQFEV